jgi:hypothetical protein
MKKIVFLINIIFFIFLSGCFDTIDSHFDVPFSSGIYSNNEVISLNDLNVNNVSLTLIEINKEEYNDKKGVNVLTDYSSSLDKYYAIKFRFDFEDGITKVSDLTFKGWNANQPNAYAFDGTISFNSGPNKEIHLKLVVEGDSNHVFTSFKVSFYVYDIESTNYTFQTTLFLINKGIDALIMSFPEQYSSLSYEEFIQYIPIFQNETDFLNINLPSEKSCFYGSGIFFEWFIIENVFLFQLNTQFDEESKCDIIKYSLSYYEEGKMIESTENVEEFIILLDKYLNK